MDTDWFGVVGKLFTVNILAWFWNPDATDTENLLANLDVILKIVLTSISIAWVYYKMRNERKSFKSDNES